MSRKFVERGIYFQNIALTKKESNRSFEISCDICLNRGLRIDCDRCGIRQAHRQTIAILTDIEKEAKNND